MRDSIRNPSHAGLPAQADARFIQALEHTFASTFGTPHSVAVRSASAGFLNLLLALDLPADAEVLLPASLCQTMVNATLLARCIPVFVDTDAALAMDGSDLEAKLSPASRVVVFHHPHGRACDPTAVATVCHSRKLFLVEDIAQALGAQFEGQPIGFTGRASLFSFGSGKPLSVGFGGMVTTPSKHLADRLRLHARCGLYGFPDDRVLGWGSSLSETECQQLIEAIAAFPEQLASRCRTIEQACDLLTKADIASDLVPANHQPLGHVFQRLLLTLPEHQAREWQCQVGPPLRHYLQGPLPVPPFRAPFLKKWYFRCQRPDLWDPQGERVPRFREVSATTHFLNVAAAYHQGHLTPLITSLCESPAVCKSTSA